MDEGIRIGVAAQALGVSVDTLRRWEREGRIAFERRGNRRVLAPEELPLGAVTALVGAPFFLWLLLRERGRAVGVA